MNTDVEFAITKSLQWQDLDTSLRQCLGNSPKEYEKYVISYSINHQLRFRENLIRFFYKDGEKKYYEEILEHSRHNLLLYPYHLADVMVKGLRVTPFQYYLSIIEWMIDNDKSYDSIPNFTAIDCLRLLAIGRNEYIDIMHQCKSTKKLFRRKSVPKNLLPIKPVDIHIEPWWLVETGFITDEDIKLATSGEKDLIDFIIDNGIQPAGKFQLPLVKSLYRKGFIYLEIPIDDKDFVVVQTLEGFVMNRVQGDYLEKLIYKILVSIDERTSVGELAALIQMDTKMVRNAVSLSCRLNLAKKKVSNVDVHASWNENVCSSTPNGETPNATTFPNQITMDDLLLKELNEALSDNRQSANDESGETESSLISVKKCEITDSAISSVKRIAFFFDSTLTAFLMMGNLSPDLKKHAVKMFEAGKLTNEDLDEFLNELKNVSSVRDESEGEAKRYFDHALILRETVLALRSNSTKLIDLIRCESLLSLDQEIDRFLVKNYFLLVSMAPLCKEVVPIVCPSLPHLGPSGAAVNTLWFKLFLYNEVGCGPPSILFPRGIRVKKIPKALRFSCDNILLTSWGHESSCIPLNNMLTTLNDALLYTPVLVQAYGYEEHCNKTSIIPFPFKNEIHAETGIKWSSHNNLMKLNSVLRLENTCGYVTMLCTRSHNSCTRYEEESKLDEPQNGIKSEECKALLQQELDDSRNFSSSSQSSIATVECSDTLNEENSENKDHNKANRRVKLLDIPNSTNSSNVNNWCISDCVFGVPLFDSGLNKNICSAIVQDGLWSTNNLEKLVSFNQTLTEKLSVFIERYNNISYPQTEEDNLISCKTPWPTDCLIFENGQLSVWNNE